jgi:hypothetical protein
MTEPVNRTILLLDIERFSRRDDVEQAFLRRALGSVAEDTLGEAGVEGPQQYREDRGDALIILISPDVSKATLLRALLTTTPETLRAYNRFAASSTQMRLRIVLAAGEVALDPREGTIGGIVGHDLNQACRLLDAPVLRDALRQRPEEDCVLCVSTPVYEGVVRHGHRGLRKEEFHRVAVTVKDDHLDAWLHGPVPEGHGSGQGAQGTQGAVRGSARTSAPESAPEPGAASAPASAPISAPGKAPAPAKASDGGVTFTFNGGSPSFGGGLAAGDQTAVSGGRVGGDVVMGSVHRDDARDEGR